MAKHKAPQRRNGPTSSARQKALDKAAQDTEKQYVVDLFCILLHDKYGFGAGRLEELLTAFMDEHDANLGLFNFSNQSSADAALKLRSVLDEKLQAIFKKKFEPFDERYPYAKHIDLRK